jgi:hypothetical protein
MIARRACACACRACATAAVTATATATAGCCEAPGNEVENGLACAAAASAGPQRPHSHSSTVQQQQLAARAGSWQPLRPGPGPAAGRWRLPPALLLALPIPRISRNGGCGARWCGIVFFGRTISTHSALGGIPVARGGWRWRNWRACACKSVIGDRCFSKSGCFAAVHGITAYILWNGGCGTRWC